ncbi:MAG: orotate phosphoribosyltransferase [Chlamydiales bacterium]
MKYVIIGMLLCIGSLYTNQLQPSSPLSKKISIEETDLQSVIEKLFAIGIIHSGSFTLKNSLLSPYYVDLRCAISYPKLLIQISELIHKKIMNLSFDTLCGVPYAALAITVGISMRYNIPMILIRKERKNHGMGQIIEGVYRDNHRVLIVEDVVTTGESIAKIAEILRSQGLIVSDAIVFVDREEGGKQYLKSLGIQVHSDSDYF